MEGINRKDRGQRSAGGRWEPWLQEVRLFAIRYATEHGEVHSDILHEHFTLPAGAHHNVWGCVFGKAWKDVFRSSRITNTVRPEARKRWIRVWKLKEEANANDQS